MAKWLYRFEAKSIQRYVLGTSRLREIAGASLLVQRLGDDARAWCAKLSGATVELAAAGSATISFDNDEALQAFASAWPLFCARTRPGLQIVQAWVRFESETDSADAWGELFSKLEADRMRPMASLPEIGPLVERAGRTGLGAVRDQGNAGLQDEATSAKVDAATEEKLANLARTLLSGSSLSDRTFATDNNDLGDDYVAVVHADGNGIGKRFREASTLRQQSDLSTRLDQATRLSVQKALVAVAARDHYDDKNSPWHAKQLPARPIVVGGDDVTILLRAKDALLFTVEFLRSFKEATDFTACAGVAMVKPGFPYNAAYELAEQLCASSKHQLKRPGKDTQSGLLFHRVTTAALHDWSDILTGELSASANPADRAGALCGGPWTIDRGARGIDELSGLARLLSSAAPRGAVREWLRLAHTDAVSAEAAWARFDDLRRQDEKEKEYADGVTPGLATALGALECGSNSPWRANGTTPIADALVWAAVDKKAALPPMSQAQGVQP